MWLAHRFFAETGAAPGAQATEDSLRVIEGRALFDGPEHKTWLRVGEHDGDIYLDLCDDEWRAVRVTPEGCRVIADPPIKFVRSRSMLPLPEPDPNGKIELLYDLIHVRAVGDERMIVACLSGWLRPRGPYPVLALSGEQGATKTTTGRAVRYMIDPHELKDRGPPRDEQTLIVSARNSWICAFDNLSRMPEWLADAICRLSTGGGFASRELYTGFDEVAIHVTRPVILTGIEDIATRGDLADRTIHVKLPPIDDSERITEDEFWAKAEKYRPAILGALLNGLASALKHADERPEVLTRMADFCAFVHRAEPGLGWCRGDFLAAYLANRGDGVNKVLDDRPIARDHPARHRQELVRQGDGCLPCEKRCMRRICLMPRADPFKPHLSVRLTLQLPAGLASMPRRTRASPRWNRPGSVGILYSRQPRFPQKLTFSIAYWDGMKIAPRAVESLWGAKS